MKERSGRNPALVDLEFLLGEWDMELSNAQFLPSRDDTARGQATCAWIEDGAFLVLHQSAEPVAAPSSRWVIGRDDSGPDFTVLYSDDRGVSRIYEMSVGEGLWRLWRDSPGFSQRFDGRVSPDGSKIVAHWEKSSDGSTWEHDFDITYTRR